MSTYGDTIADLRDGSGLEFNARTTPMGWTDAFSWTNQLERFKTIARGFVAEFRELELLARFATGPDKAAYTNIMENGRTIMARLSDLSKTFDWGINTFLSGSPERLNGLGLAPLILVPAALVAGLIAIISAWMSESAQLRKKLQFIRDQQEQGKSAAEIDKLLQTSVGSPESGGIVGTIAKWAGLAVVGYLLIQAIKK